MIWFAFLLSFACNECNTTVWELHYQGQMIIGGTFDTKEECEQLRAEIDPQIPAFTELKCVEIPAIRHDS